MSERSSRTCPCCGDALEEPPLSGSVDLSDSRPDDMWCERCHWLLIAEELEAEHRTIRCPRHE